ncbi:MAG TPA: hypothetical protein VMP01_15760 [Pirellulaceae bacterium]|nr:hypothetical protein [Pirellulaceae bacterium]
MPLCTDVIVRKDEVTFPKTCVVCGRTVEDENARLRGNPVGFYGVIPWIFGATKKLNVPAHQQCGSKLSRALLIRNLALIVGVTAVLIVAVSLGLTKWQALGLAIAAIAIPIVWQVIRPLPFEFTHHSGQFKLMFLDPAYAREIATLNDGELKDGNENGSEQVSGGNGGKRL